MFRKYLAIMLTVALAMVSLVALVNDFEGATPASAQQPPTVLMRLVHAIPGAGEVDIYVDGDLVAPAVDFTEATPHIPFAEGDHTVAIRVAGTAATEAAVFEDTVTLTARADGFRHATVVIQANTEGAPQYAQYVDDLTPSALGTGRIHAIHAVAGAGAVDVLNTNRALIAGNLQFNTPAGTVNAPVDVYDLVVAPTGGLPEDAILSIGEVEVNTNMLYTVIIAGEGSDLQPIILSRPMLPDPTVENVLVSVAHGSSDAPAVDVYVEDGVNNSKILANLEPGEITPHFPLPAGEVNLVVRGAGSPGNSEPAFSANVSISSPTGAATLAALGSLGDGTFAFNAYPSDVDAIPSDQARVVVLNSASTGPASASLDDGTRLADGLSVFSTSSPVDVPAGTYTVSGMVDDETGPVSFELGDQTFIGGTYNTLLVFLADDASLAVSQTAVNLQANSLPGALAGTAVAAVPDEGDTTGDTGDTTDTTDTADTAAQATPVPTEAPLPPAPTETPPPPPPATTAPTTPQGNQLIGVVNLNSGVNLQCREYPTTAAFSLGLIPNGAELIINGYAGPPDEEFGQPITPVEEGAFDEPTLAEDFEEIWVNVDFRVDGGILVCWVRADFLVMSYRNRSIRDVEDFFALEELEVFPAVLEAVPSNFPGGPEDDSDVTISPPTPTRDDPLATVNVDSGVSLHLRRFPSNDAESLALLPNGTEMFVLERTEVDQESEIGAPTTPVWLFVEYTTEMGTTTGWVSADYVTLTQRGRSIELEDIPQAEDIVGGEAGPEGGAVPPPPSGVSAGADEYVGTLINLNVGANLNLRDDTSTDARVVASIPANSQIIVLGRSGSGAWLNVRYEIAGGDVFEGWVSSNFVEVRRNDRLVSIGDLPILTGEADTFVEDEATTTDDTATEEPAS